MYYQLFYLILSFNWTISINGQIKRNDIYTRFSDLLEIEGETITIDIISTQTNIINKII